MRLEYAGGSLWFKAVRGSRRIHPPSAPVATVRLNDLLDCERSLHSFNIRIRLDCFLFHSPRSWTLSPLDSTCVLLAGGLLCWHHITSTATAHGLIHSTQTSGSKLSSTYLLWFFTSMAR